MQVLPGSSGIGFGLLLQHFRFAPILQLLGDDVIVGQQLVCHACPGVGMHITAQVDGATLSRKALHDVILRSLGEQLVEAAEFRFPVACSC